MDLLFFESVAGRNGEQAKEGAATRYVFTPPLSFA